MEGVVVVLDNGSGSLKGGFAGEVLPRCDMPNCIGNVARGQKDRHLIGDRCLTASSPYYCLRPFERGLLVNLDMQRDIWDRFFSRSHLNILDKIPHCGLLISEPYNTPASIRHGVSELVFEDFGFEELVISPSQQLALYGFPHLQILAQENRNRPRLRSEDVAMKDMPASEVNVFGDEIVGVWRPIPSQEDSRHNKRRRLSLDIMEKRELRFDSSTDSPPICSYNQFRSVLSPIADQMSIQNPCYLVVDCGHQTCWALPFYGEFPMDFAAQRMDLGGSHLTTILRNWVSQRHFPLEKYELVVQNMKETCCFVSQNFYEDMTQSKKEMSSYRRRNVPNSTHLFCPYALPPTVLPKNKAALSRLKSQNPPTPSSVLGEEPRGMEATISLNHERIAVPEVLFHPQDAGVMKVCGISEMIQRAIFSSPPQLQPCLAANILTVGGSSKFPNFCKRLYDELRACLPQHWPIRIVQSQKDPAWSVWRGASIWASSRARRQPFIVTKEEYFERGHTRRPAQTSYEDFSSCTVDVM